MFCCPRLRPRFRDLPLSSESEEEEDEEGYGEREEEDRRLPHLALHALPELSGCVGWDLCQAELGRRLLGRRDW